MRTAEKDELCSTNREKVNEVSTGRYRLRDFLELELRYLIVRVLRVLDFDSIYDTHYDCSEIPEAMRQCQSMI
jgi:hypothetical protein